MRGGDGRSRLVGLRMRRLRGRVRVLGGELGGGRCGVEGDGWGASVRNPGRGVVVGWDWSWERRLDGNGICYVEEMSA